MERGRSFEAWRVEKLPSRVRRRCAMERAGEEYGLFGTARFPAGEVVPRNITLRTDPANGRRCAEPRYYRAGHAVWPVRLRENNVAVAERRRAS